jgi:hypothetical protein
MGKKQVNVTEPRIYKDWGEAMIEFSDVDYPDAEAIAFVRDNQNSHSPASSL